MPPSPNRVVHLADEGLSPGDDITPYLEDHWESGNHVIIPGGTYAFNGDGGAIGIDATEDSWLEGDGLVVLDNDYSEVRIQVDNDAYVRYQNIEFADQADSGQRVWTESFDSIIEFVNYNIYGQPGTDRYGIYGAGEGENIGLIRFINCTVENFSDGIYMSSPFENDDPLDGSATVEVYGGLYRNCETSNIRVGGHDSKVIGVTSVANNIPSGISNINCIFIREAGENQIIRDCDVYVSGERDDSTPIYVQSERFEGDRGTSVFIEDCRIYCDNDKDYVNVSESGTHVEGNNLHLTGSQANESLDDVLEGTGPYTNITLPPDAEEPTREKKFVDPETLDPDGGGGTPDPEHDHTLVIDTFSDPRSGVVYEFVVEGSVDPGADSELGNNDAIIDQGDGTFLVQGTTGGGFTDDWLFTGAILEMTVEQHPDEDSGNYMLFLDGSEVTIEELIEKTGGSINPPQIETCSIGLSSVGENAALPLSVTITNNNQEALIFNIDWIAIDIDGEPVIASLNGETIPGSTPEREFTTEFVPSQSGLEAGMTTRIRVSITDVGRVEDSSPINDLLDSFSL